MLTVSDDEELKMVVELRSLLIQETDKSSSSWPLNDQLLIFFVRGRKYNVPRAFKSLKKYLEMVKYYPELMTNLYESQLRCQLDKRLLAISNGRDRLGRHILFFRAGRWNPDESTCDQVFRCVLYCLQRLASERQVQCNGIVLIVDLLHARLSKVLQVSPLYVKKAADIALEALPLRISAIHVVHTNWTISLIKRIFDPFLPTKLKERIKDHGSNVTLLHEHIDPSELPSDYGRSHESLDNFDWSTVTVGCNYEANNMFKI